VLFEFEEILIGVVEQTKKANTFWSDIFDNLPQKLALIISDIFEWC